MREATRLKNKKKYYNTTKVSGVNSRESTPPQEPNSAALLNSALQLSLDPGSKLNVPKLNFKSLAGSSSKQNTLSERTQEPTT